MGFIDSFINLVSAHHMVKTAGRKCELYKQYRRLIELESGIATLTCITETNTSTSEVINNYNYITSNNNNKYVYYITLINNNKCSIPLQTLHLVAISYRSLQKNLAPGLTCYHPPTSALSLMMTPSVFQLDFD